MAFNPNIPQPSDSLSQSQADILANFQAIAPLFNQGIQNFVLLPVQGSAPATGATEVALYSKSVSGAPELFMRRASNGTEFNFTSSDQSTNGWGRLPSGILFKWGTKTGVPINSVSGALTFPTGGSIPVFSSIFSLQLTNGISTNSDYNQALILNTFNTTGFTVFVRQLSGLPLGNTQTIYYFAIGV